MTGSTLTTLAANPETSLISMRSLSIRTLDAEASVFWMPHSFLFVFSIFFLLKNTRFSTPSWSTICSSPVNNMLSLSFSSPFLIIPRSPAHEGMHRLRKADFANLTHCLHPIYPHKQVLQINAPTCTVTNNKNPHIWGLRSGTEGIRTPDLLSAIEALSQLRYRPSFLEMTY